MNGVLGAAQLLRMSDLNPRQSSFVDIITQSGDGLLVLLNDILDLTKIEVGRMDLAPVLIETEGLMERLIGPFGAQAEAKGLRFSAEQSGEWPALACLDPLRLAQISNNLLGNAIKFTPAGEVRFVMDGGTPPRWPAGVTHRHSRQRHRHRAGGSGASVPALHPGRRFLHPAVRRHRPGPQHLSPPRGADGRSDHRAVRSRARLGLHPRDRGRRARMDGRPNPVQRRLISRAAVR